MYTIKIKYETGNSFGHHTEESEVDYIWDTIELAREALQNIQAHYKHYRECDKSSSIGVYSPDSMHPHTESWFLTKELNRNSHSNGSWAFSVGVPNKEGTGYTYISSFWCGYFERLLEASVVMVDDTNNPDKITF